MLGSTLRVFSFSELMNSSTRLGFSGMVMGKTGASMLTTIDPNFYAMNVIACISSGCLLLLYPLSKTERFVLISSVIGCGICCLIGLSRTYIIMLCIWIFMYLISQKSIKTITTIILAGLIVTVVFIHFMPTVIEGFQSRFKADDVIGGNGRIELIVLYYNLWFSDLNSIMFGIGLFNCHTHCSPLLYLYGLGIVGYIPLVCWFIYNWNMCKQTSNTSFRQYIPFIITFIGFSTIPAVGSMNYTMPILVAMLAAGMRNDEIKNREHQSRWKYLQTE